MRLFAFLLVFVLIAFPAIAQNSPPAGNNLPVQPAKTGNYTIKSTDLKTIIPMNCSSPCTVTMPQITSSFPKGYPAVIQNIGPSAVTITAITSVIYGLPTTAGNLDLITPGNWVTLTADTANRYLAYGFVGSGGGGGTFRLTDNNGRRLTNNSGLRLTNGS